MANLKQKKTDSISIQETHNKDIPSSASNNTATCAVENVKRPSCRGNACSRCGKCCDWRYVGNIDQDYEHYSRGGSYDIYDDKRWYRNPNGPSVTCSYFYYAHFGPIGTERGFDICRCE